MPPRFRRFAARGCQVVFVYEQVIVGAVVADGGENVGGEERALQDFDLDLGGALKLYEFVVLRRVEKGSRGG